MVCRLLCYIILIYLDVDQLTLGDSMNDQQQTSSNQDTAASIRSGKRNSSETRGGSVAGNRTTIQHQARRTSRAAINNEIETQLESLVLQTGGAVLPSHFTLFTPDNQGAVCYV